MTINEPEGNACLCCGGWFPWPENIDMTEMSHPEYGSGFACPECIEHNDDWKVVT